MKKNKTSKTIAANFRATKKERLHNGCMKEQSRFLSLATLDPPFPATLSHVAAEFEKISGEYINGEEFTKAHPGVGKIDKPSLIKISGLSFIAEELGKIIAPDIESTGLKEFLADKEIAKTGLSSLSQNEGIKFRSWHEYSEYLDALPADERERKFAKFSRVLAKYPSFMMALEGDIFANEPESWSPAIDAVREAAYQISTKKFAERIKRIKITHERLIEQAMKVFESVVDEAKCTVCRRVKQWSGIVFITRAILEGIGCNEDGTPKKECI